MIVHMRFFFLPQFDNLHRFLTFYEMNLYEMQPTKCSLRNTVYEMLSAKWYSTWIQGSLRNAAYETQSTKWSLRNDTLSEFKDLYEMQPTKCSLRNALCEMTLYVNLRISTKCSLRNTVYEILYLRNDILREFKDLYEMQPTKCSLRNALCEMTLYVNLNISFSEQISECFFSSEK